MSRIWDHTDHAKWQRFNGRQIDPTRRNRGRGTYFRPGHDRILVGPDSFMPCGEHMGKHLRAVPVDYLAWVDAQPWSQTWDGWQPVQDYLSRFPPPEGRTLPAVPLYLSPYDGPQPPGKCTPRTACLHTLPGWEEYLHAFVVGGLHLSRDWYKPGRLPHYELTEVNHLRARDLGAVEISLSDAGKHTQKWLDHFRRDTITAAPSTHTPLRNHML